MPVFLDVESRLDRASAAAAAKEITAIFEGVGRGVSRNLSGALSQGLGAFDTAKSREQIDLLKLKFTEAAQAQELLAQKAEAASLRSAAAWRSAETAVDKYGAASARAMRATATATDATAAATFAASKHAKSVEDTTTAHQNLTTAVAGSTGALNRFNGATTLAATAAVGGFIAGAVDATKAAGDFQVQLTRLNTVAGEAPQNLKLIHDGLMDLASKTGWDPTDLAHGMLTVEQHGYRAADALTVFKAVAQGAAEEGTDLGETANAVTGILGDYHLNVSQATDVTSKLVEAVGKSGTNFTAFTGALHNVLATAAAAKEPLDDLLATMALMTKSGMHPDQASDNLNHALSSLSKIGPQQREMISALGLDPRNISGQLATQGYIPTVQTIRSAVDQRLGPNGNVILSAFENNPASQALEQEEYGKLSPNERSVADRIKSGQLSKAEFRKTSGGLGVTEAKVVDAYLSTHERNQGFNRVLTSLNTDQMSALQALQTALGGQDNARTALQVTDQNNPLAMQARKDIEDAKADPSGNVKGFDTAQQNFNAQWKDLKASIEALKIEFGEDFLPTATKWVQSLETGVHWMQQHRALVKDLIEDVTALSALFLGMKLATGLVNTVKSFREAFGLTKTAVDQANTAMRESGPAAQAGASGVNAAASSESAAQQRVKSAVYQANEELRNSASAAQAGASGVTAAANEEVGAENRVKSAAYQANAEMRAAGAAAEAGAAGVTAAANTEVGAMGRVTAAASRAKAALALTAATAASMGGDALQANTRANTNPNKVGVIASDAGNAAVAGGVIGSFIPGVGTALGAGVGALLGGGYAVWDQYFSGDHDVAAPDNPNPDAGPVPTAPEPDTSQPTPDVAPPIPETSRPETPDTPYAGGGGGGGGGKKPKDEDPLDEDLKRIERLQTEANEIQARIADDKASNDPARRGEIPWLQKKLDEINRELSGIRGQGGGRGAGGSGSPFMPVELAENPLSQGLPGLAKWTIGFLEDLVLGPLEVAAFHGRPDFTGASASGSRHSRRGRRGREEDDLGPEPRDEGLPGLPGGIPGMGAPKGVVPVFVTNWGSGGPGAGAGASGAGGAGDSGGGGGSGAPSGGPDSSGTGGPGGGAATSPSPGQLDLNGPLTPDQIRSLSPAQQKQLLQNAFHPETATAGAPDAGGVPIYQAADGTWHSSNPAWEHLIQRESSGRNIRQQITDSNSGGNEAFGIFQITPATWAAHGGQGSVYNSTPQEQAIIAERILRGNPSGSDWGAGLAGRENAQALLAGLPAPHPTGPKRSDEVEIAPGVVAGGSPGHTYQRRLSSPESSTPGGSGDTSTAQNFYKDWYPQKPRSDADILPPEALQDAREHGMLDANGNLIPGAVPMIPPAPGSLNNPKSVAPRVKMQPDLSRLITPKPPQPSEPSHSDDKPWVNPTTNQPWWGGGPGHGGGFNFGKAGDSIRSFFDPNSHWFAKGGKVGYFATGGPSGTDTIPAWLSPGEFVMNAQATQNYLPYLQFMNSGVGHYAPGTGDPVQPGQPSPPPNPAAQPPTAAPNLKPPMGQPQQAQMPGKPSLEATQQQPGQKSPVPPPPGDQQGTTKEIGATDPSSDLHNLKGLAQPGGQDPNQQPGQGLPASQGIGFGGGLLGSVEGAAEQGASMAANMFAPGSGQAASSAMSIAFQELNRAASYGAQLGGIAAEGVLEALIPSSGSGGGDWMKTIPGRLLAGVAGVRPTGQNTAGNTQQVNPASQDSQSSVAQQINGDVHVHAQNPNEFENWGNRQAEMAQNTQGSRATGAIP